MESARTPALSSEELDALIFPGGFGGGGFRSGGGFGGGMGGGGFRTGGGF